MPAEKKLKFKLIDIVLLTLITAALVYIVYRIKVTIRYDWSWEIIPKYLFRFDKGKSRFVASTITLGFTMTIKLSIWGIILGTIIGLIMGILRVQSGLFARFAGRAYVELIRNIPPIVLVFIFYFFFSSQLLDHLGIEDAITTAGPGLKRFISIIFIEPKLLNEFFSAALSIALYEGAYITEIVRSGIESIPKGQWEAAHAIGLSRFSQFRHIILPQALKNVLPPLSGQFISTIKDSAIVSVISVPELSFQGMQVMASTYATFETWIVITLLYFMLTFSCSVIFGKLLRKMQTAD
ncbi:MAG: amino acid ABC transporter permease [Spirochaetales bacterium]|uniref:Amino acid ABC transporter permease n=1 Tax=Candidatus Thalassospirochaeta sargassi TaxID=3119039 RepID=A0AAJ1IDE7_9SPIO|nr:amino acid ABC transporter permease [Spirochaetales bacterium]